MELRNEQDRPGRLAVSIREERTTHWERLTLTPPSQKFGPRALFTNFLSHIPAMSFQIDGASEVAQLSAHLNRLQTDPKTGATSATTYVPRRPASRDGYGFRKSGVSTPILENEPAATSESPLVPDPNGLGWPAKSTINRLNATPEEKADRERRMALAIREILDCIGEDPDREGLLRTPERYSQALLYMTKGYEERLADVINDAVFAEDHDEMVIVRDIEISSLCEHHLVPFTGKVRLLFSSQKFSALFVRF